MYERIMVPLDGSTTAEMALPYAIEIATYFNSEIVLFSVIEIGGTHTESLFHSYLGVISTRIREDVKPKRSGNAAVRIQIVAGNPASEILHHADSDGIDLIIMTSRGSSVDSIWALGNIATKIVRIAAKPVMVVKTRAKGSESGRKTLVSRILVPLDGSRVGEAAVPHAEEMARKLQAELVLFHAVEPAAGWPTARDSIVRARDENEVKAARVYLDDVARALTKKGLPVSSRLVTGYPAEEIVNYAETHDIDLITISTHGRSGVGRWAIGSVTDKLLYAGNIPILVEHAKSQ